MRTLTSGPSDHLANTTKLSEYIDADEDVLLYFWAPWCAPCKRLTPVLEALSKDEKIAVDVSFGSVNIDVVDGAAQSFNVNSIPMIVLMRGGKELRRMAGFAPAEAIKRFLSAS